MPLQTNMQITQTNESLALNEWVGQFLPHQLAAMLTSNECLDQYPEGTKDIVQKRLRDFTQAPIKFWSRYISSLNVKELMSVRSNSSQYPPDANCCLNSALRRTSQSSRPFRFHKEAPPQADDGVTADEDGEGDDEESHHLQGHSSAPSAAPAAHTHPMQWPECGALRAERTGVRAPCVALLRTWRSAARARATE